MTNIYKKNIYKTQNKHYNLFKFIKKIKLKNYYKKKIGYIYVRTNEYWDLYNAYKLGKTINFNDRETQYVTSEIKRGHYIMIIQLDIDILDIIEKKLQKYFNSLNYHVKINGGNEFYKKEIINCIEYFLVKNNISHKILSENEINNLTRTIRIYESEIIKNNIIDNNKSDDTSDDISDNISNNTSDDISDNISNNISNDKNDYISNNTSDDISDNISDNISDDISDNINNNKNEIYISREYQNDIIENAKEYYKNKNKGLIIIPCGVGKTLISLWIANILNFKSILIGVPNKTLLYQWKEIVQILFNDVPYLLVKSGICDKKINNFIKKNNKKCIIITTYASSYKIYNATKDNSFIFSIIINDECHHLTTTNIKSSKTTKKFIQILNIKSEKQLSLTATIKTHDNICDDKNIVSNDSMEYFGEIILKKCLLWGINNNIICDYVIQTIIANEEQMNENMIIFNITEENNKRLFLSAYSSLKSLYDGHSHHILIYSNNKNNASKIIEYIKMLIEKKYFEIPDIYYSDYNGDMKTTNQKKIIKKFSDSNFGIISCVYCLGEGYDNHIIDAVVFAENMSSEIRIVQSSSRAGRKNKNEPNKIAKIILPILNKYDLLENNNSTDYKKIREVIYQMGLEDETVTQKIKVFNIEVKKHSIKKYNNISENINNFGDYDEELTNKLKLNTIKREDIGLSYEQIKKIIKNKNIKNKKEYFELCEEDNRLSKEPEIFLKKKFINWIDYLGIERVYYNFETCKNKINEYLLLYPELKKYHLNLHCLIKELCKLDNKFPPNDLWIEYYDTKNLKNIFKFGTNKKKGVINN
jgi:predicted helicase